MVNSILRVLMSEPVPPLPEPANLRLLRRLVTLLMAVMIGGLLVIVGVFVMHFSASRPVVPETLTLPDGVRAESFTMAPDWYGVVTEGGARFLIFDRTTGALRQEIEVQQGPARAD